MIRPAISCNEMSLRSRVLGLVEVVLRVPPLFVIDEILKFGIGLEELTEHDLSSFQEKFEQFEENIRSNATTVPYNPVFYKFFFVSLLRLLLSAVG